MDPKPPIEIRITAAAKCPHFSADEVEGWKERLVSMLLKYLEYKLQYDYHCYSIVIVIYFCLDIQGSCRRK